MKFALHATPPDAPRQTSTERQPICDETGKAHLQAYLGGDPRAFQCFVQHYHGLIWGYIVRCGVAPHERDDVAQEIYVRLYRAAHTYDNSRALRPWVFTVVANTVRSHFRKLTVWQRYFRPVVDYDNHAGKTPSVLESAVANQTARCVERELQKLPQDQREALVLHTLVELDQASIAQMLGIPVNTVKTHIRRARIKLAKQLKHLRERGRKQ